MIVYVHKNQKTEQIFYVGIGVNKERAYRFGGNSRNQFWRNYVKKHGEPIVEIVATFDNRQDAENLEMELIDKYKRVCDGGTLVNITLGGDGGALGVKQSEESKQKKSEKLRGFVHSEETRRNMKQAQNRPEVKAKHEAYKKTKEWRDLQRNAKLGRKLTDEQKEKISASLKGRVSAKETKQKISIANKGKIRNAEQRLNISNGKKGKKLAETHKNNCANGHKKIILNTENGIFYKGFEEAANSIGINKNTLRCKLSGHLRNNTPFIYA